MFSILHLNVNTLSVIVLLYIGIFVLICYLPGVLFIQFVFMQNGLYVFLYFVFIPSSCRNFLSHAGYVVLKCCCARLSAPFLCPSECC